MVSLREFNEIMPKELQAHKKHWANGDSNPCYFAIGCLHNHRHVVLVSLTSALSSSPNTVMKFFNFMGDGSVHTVQPPSNQVTKSIGADLNYMLRIVTRFPKPGHSTDLMVHLETFSISLEVLE